MKPRNLADIAALFALLMSAPAPAQTKPAPRKPAPAKTQKPSGTPRPTKPAKPQPTVAVANSVALDANAVDANSAGGVIFEAPVANATANSTGAPASNIGSMLALALGGAIVGAGGATLLLKRSGARPTKTVAAPQIAAEREELLARALADADPHNLRALDAKDLRATMQMAARLDALCRGETPAASARAQLLPVASARGIERWAHELAQGGGDQGALKSEIGALEKKVERLQKGLAQTQDNARADAAEISELRANLERQQAASARERKTLLQGRLDALEELSREHQHSLAQKQTVVGELARENERIETQLRELQASLKSEFERGAAQVKTEMGGELERLKRFADYAGKQGQQAGELEEAARAALERLSALSNSATLTGLVGFLLEHCLNQLAQGVYRNQKRRREMALSGLYAIAQGFDRLPAFAHLAARVREIYPEAGRQTEQSAAPHRDRTLFYLVLSAIRRDTAGHRHDWGEFPRAFGYDLDENGVTLRVVSDD